MEEVDISPLSPDRFATVVDPDQHRAFEEALERSRRGLGGRTLWHVNSTAQGGGVAEMLQSLLGYLAGAEIHTRWVVMEADEEFFDLTKRVHNLLHGEDGDEGDLSREDRRRYEGALAANVGELNRAVASGDVVILHDPQTVGMAPALKRAGARVVWSCHIGVDTPNDLARAAWDFLRPYVAETDAQVFSRRSYAWEGLDTAQVNVIPPCIDAFSSKNQRLDEGAGAAILEASGILRDEAPGEPSFRRQDGSTAKVTRSAEMIEEAPLPSSAPIVLQVSRWDRLKDPIGVLRGFAAHVPGRLDAHLVLAGPAAASVTDDPEGEEVLEEVCGARTQLDQAVRRRVHVACLPMEDLDENGAIVNALQRRADVCVQKSLAEGFGLTVAEAMWKERPTVGSRLGGIQDQIVHGQSGLLVDPEDPTDFGAAVATLLDDRDLAARMGEEAHARVRDEYLAPRHLGRYMSLVGRLVEDR